MKISQLLENANLTHYEFFGNPADDIYDIALYTPNLPSVKEVLYLTSDSDALKNSDSGKFNFLLFPSSYVCEEALTSLQAVIKEDYHKRLLISQLYNASSILEIQQICIEVMGNMILFLNQNFRPYDASAVSSFQLPSTSLMLASLRPHGAPCIINMNENNGRFLLAEIRDMTETAISYILVLENEQIFVPSRDLNYLQLICDTLFGRLHLNNHYIDQQLSTPGGLIRAILSNQLTSPHIIREITSMLNWPENKADLYYLLTITGPILSRPLSLRNQLRTMLNNKIYIYNQYYIVLLDSAWDETITLETFPELNDFLNKNNLSAGLSYGFSDIVNLGNAFQQTLVALASCSEKCSHPENPSFVRYEDIIFSHFFALARNAGLPLISFCHPVMERILDYDKQNHTEYLLTLAAFILKGQNLQSAANALYIHKNTMYNRLLKMRDLFMMNLDDPDLQIKLYISVLIYSYIGLLNIQLLK